MDKNQPKSTENKSLFTKIIDNHWVRVILEIIAFILLISKLIPDSWLKTEWPFLVLLSLTLFSLLYSNFRLTRNLINEVKSNSKEIENLKTLNEIKIEQLERKSRYADVIPILNAAFQELHNALRRDFSDKKMYHESFVVFCNELQNVFSKITGVECHVCIKMTLFPNSEIPNPNKMGKILDTLQVKTYCRGSSSSSLRKQIDYGNQSHPVSENTDFEYVFKDRDVSFFCPDLAKIDGYKNSSFKIKNGGSPSHFPPGTPFEEKVKLWPLDYRSTIVASIRPLVEIEKDEHIILGLLCVDSQHPDVFNETLDKHIMIGCADGLYNSFKKLFTAPKTTISSKTKSTPI